MMYTLFYLVIALALCWELKVVYLLVQYERMRKKLCCPPLRKYRSWDRALGLDYVYSMMKAIKEDRFLPFQRKTYAEHGASGWTANFLGHRMVYTAASEHMKALSTSHRDNFAVEPIRVGNGAITPFTGRGVSSADGSKWQSSRDLIKPYFERAAIRNLRRLDAHITRLLANIPMDGMTVDMQPLFQRYFLDTSTEFLFGETIDSLSHDDRSWPSRDMRVVQAGLRVRLQLSSFLFLHRDRDWLAACSRIHEWLDGYIGKAYTQLLDQELSGQPATYHDGRPRDDFLWTIAQQVPDKLELRTQLISVWIPSNETTSILLSNTLWALARHPEVTEKIRQEVRECGAQPLTFESLRSLTYLRWTINESHRLYPVSLQTVRACIKDTALPGGGAQSRVKPIFCAKGDIVHCNRFLMHRDVEFWGPDADEFRPDRWCEARPMWNFAPYGGGSRICPAHIMVDTECSYVIARLLQCFKSIEARDDYPYTAVMRVGPSNKYGCRVGFIPDHE